MFQVDIFISMCVSCVHVCPVCGGQVGEEVVKSPGQVTLTVYAACPDITKTVTPDLKAPGTGQLLFVDLGGRAAGECIPLGGTALSTVYGQVGDACSDVRDPHLLRRSFEAVQRLLDERLLLAGHDRWACAACRQVYEEYMTHLHCECLVVMRCPCSDRTAV